MKNKGQALVEFVIVLPVMLIVFLGMFDLGSVFLKQYHLENDLDHVIELYRDDQLEAITEYVKSQNIQVTYDKKVTDTTISVSSSVPINTPLLNFVLGNPHQVLVKRVIQNAK